jgi:hypothetical protein
MKVQDFIIVGFVLAMISAGLFAIAAPIDWWRVMIRGLALYFAALSIGCVRMASK